MAAVATPPVLTIHQYLSTSFERDMEFIDGELKEEPMPAPVHARIQSLLSLWFGQLENEHDFECFVEARTRVAATRVRLSDFAMLPAAPIPDKALTEAPLLAIEVLSDEDKHKDLIGRANDLKVMGCQAIWLLDPDEKAFLIWSGQEWLRSDEEKPMTPAGVPLNLPWLWQKVSRRKRSLSKRK